MTTLYILLLIAICRNCLVQSATRHYRPLRYTIPQPLIQAFKPRGLQGNINKPLDESETEAFQSGELEKDGQRWAYKNSTLRVHVGDKIYYKLHVVKDNLRYRIHNVHEIKELLPLDDARSASPAADCTVCKNVVSDLMQRLIDSQQEIDSQREANDILKDLVKKYPETSRTLVLDGVNVKDDELVVIVRAIINDKLHLSVKANNVRRVQGGKVSFEVDGVEEKVDVIRAARKELKTSKFKFIY